jgi:hypothetical protein
MRIAQGFVLTAVLLCFSASAQASHVLDTGSGYQNGPLSVAVVGHNGDNPFQTAAGSIGLAPNFASLDGIPLPFMYCVELFTDINVPGSYSADLSTTGVIHGGSIANAGQIAWLVTHIAPTATTQDQQEGLQAAIWQQVYGSDFSVNQAGTGAGIYANYLADLAALGSNTAPVSSVLWISPYNGDGSWAQGQVSAFSTPVPEPATIALLGLGACCVVGLRLRKRFA